MGHQLPEHNTFLHVGCGSKRAANTPFAGLHWHEIRLDIDPAAKPNLIGTITDMSAVENGALDALFSSHNIEHLYPHEFPLALAEFRRVLKLSGFALITCPDLRSVCAQVAADKLAEAACVSPAAFDLWALATTEQWPENELRYAAARMFPSTASTFPG